MNGWELLVVVLLVGLAFEECIAAAIYLVACRPRPCQVPDKWPSATVVLALRGADDSLPDCLRALFHQNYPHYRVCIVVDSEDDPSWAIVADAIDRWGVTHVDVRALHAKRDTCSLKCSALLQATEDLDVSSVVAFLDSDIVPDQNWLRELVAPLSDERVGATTGNRWYDPLEGQCGSWTRYLWNAAAVVNMYLWRIPWGGSMALRVSTLRESGVRGLWARAACEDVPLGRVLRRMSKRLHVVPRLILVNREECSVPDCLRFVARQLLWLRLYHPLAWWLCTLRFVLIVSSLWGASVCIAMASVAGRTSAAIGIAACLVGFGATLALLLLCLDRHVRRCLESSDHAHLPRAAVLRAIPVSQAVSAIAILQALLARRVMWRGVEYSIHGPWRVRMLEYRPFLVPDSESDVETVGRL